MAGARLGYGIGSPALIADLNTIKYSTNPYNVNSMSAAAGLGVMADEPYTVSCCQEIMKTRTNAMTGLKKLGFEMTDAKGNFLFVRHPKMSGEAIYLALKKRGILVRHFNSTPISDYNRITVGTPLDMQTLIDTLADILKEIK